MVYGLAAVGARDLLPRRLPGYFEAAARKADSIYVVRGTILEGMAGKVQEVDRCRA